MTEITCNELVDTVTAYLEDTLPPDDRQRFDAHLNNCPFCTDYLAQMRTTIGRLGELDTNTLSTDARLGVLDAFRDWQNRGPQ